MKVIYLAAGMGKRMGVDVMDSNKCLIELNGMKLIDIMMNQLISYNINEYIFVLGHNKTLLEKYILDAYPELNIKIVTNDIYNVTNNIYSFKLALDEMQDDDFILVESDVVLIDESAIGKLISNKNSCALISPYADKHNGTAVRLKENNCSFILNPSDFEYENIYKTVNLYKFIQKDVKIIRNFIDFYSDNIRTIYYEEIFSILRELDLINLEGIIINNEDWCEIDTWTDYYRNNIPADASKAYDVLSSYFGGYWNFDVNDKLLIKNPKINLGAIYSKLKNNLYEYISSYSSNAYIISKKLNNYLRLDNLKGLVYLNGLSQVYPILTDYINNDKVLIPSRVFGEYKKLSMNIETYTCDYVLGIDLTEIESKISLCDYIVIVNPNNPTGHGISLSYLNALISKYQNKTFIIDETFIDFTNMHSILGDIELNKYPNVIYLKSLGKLLALSGLRIGYAYSYNREFIAYLNASLPIWNCNSISEVILEELPKYEKIINNSIKSCFLEYDIGKSKLQSEGLNVISNDIKLFYIIKNDKVELDYEYLKRGILIKKLESGIYRISL